MANTTRFSFGDVLIAVLLTLLLLGSALNVMSALQSSVYIPSNGRISYQSLPFEDGFETANLNSWSGTTTTSGETARIIDGSSHHGSHSVSFISDGMEGFEASYIYMNILPTQEVYGRAYFMISSSGIADNDDRFFLLKFSATGNNVALAGWRKTGNTINWTLTIRDGTGWVTVSSNLNPVVQQWYSVELHWLEHSISGKGELYVNGDLVCSISSRNTALLGSADIICIGLTESQNCASTVAYADCVAFSGSYIGPEVNGKWAVVGQVDKVPQLKNIFWLFGNQDIPYVNLYPNEVTNFNTIKDYSGLVIWTNLNGVYNNTAVKLFAKTRPVVSHMYDFCSNLYPTLKSSMQTVYMSVASYVIDWGNFRIGDRAEMHNGTKYLTAVSTAGLGSFSNITIIAKPSTNTVVLFQMTGANDNAGFFVIDLRSTRPDSFEAGNYHIFPAISKTSTIRAGYYARWITDALAWRSLDWIYEWMTNLTAANSDIVTMRSIGNSVQGRPINALFIGKGTRYFIADGAIHGDEKSGAHAIVRFAELVVEWYRSSASWQKKLSEFKLILIPVLNPDGYVADTRENGRSIDLNRQFPPGATTTEPEAWSLRWLMGNFTPTHYVSFHADGPSYPLYTFYSAISEPYKSYSRLVVNEGDLLYQDLKHWGKVYDSKWIGNYTIVGPSGSGSLTYQYAAYMYNAIAIMPEHPTQNKPGGNLNAQDFYISTLLAPLMHNEKTNGALIHSNTFLTEAKFANSTTLNIAIDASNIAGGRTSETRVYDFNGRGKPKTVLIDGVQRLEGDQWTWNSVSTTTTITRAKYAIILKWA